MSFDITTSISGVRVEFSEEAKTQLSLLKLEDSERYGHVLAALQYYLGSWIPGATEPDGVKHHSKLSKACNFPIYRIKDKQLLGDWRIWVLVTWKPPPVFFVVGMARFENQDTYDDLLQQHNIDIKRFVLQLKTQKRLP